MEYSLKGGNSPKMEDITTNQIETYLCLWNQIKARVQDEKVAVSLLSEICKDRRMQQMKRERTQHIPEPASKNQIRYLRRLGIDVRNLTNLTRTEASKLIDEALAE
jgi:hypothetical protein